MACLKAVFAGVLHPPAMVRTEHTHTHTRTHSHTHTAVASDHSLQESERERVRRRICADTDWYTLDLSWAFHTWNCKPRVIFIPGLTESLLGYLVHCFPLPIHSLRLVISLRLRNFTPHILWTAGYRSYLHIYEVSNIDWTNTARVLSCMDFSDQCCKKKRSLPHFLSHCTTF